MKTILQLTGQFLLNVFFFILYGITGFYYFKQGNPDIEQNIRVFVSWQKFFVLFLFFSCVAFLSIFSTYAFSGILKNNRKGKMSDSEASGEVTPDIIIDGVDETPDTLIDILENKAGKVFPQEPKRTAKKKSPRSGKSR